MKFKIYGSLSKRKLMFNNDNLFRTHSFPHTHMMTYRWAQWSHPSATGVYLTKVDTLENN